MYSLITDADERVVDCADAVGNLHLLYLMTFSPLGKRAVSYVICLEDNLLVLLPFAELTGMRQIMLKFKIFLEDVYNDIDH